jgi:selenide, water dikinase
MTLLIKRLVLLGGGHSHVEVIRRLGLQPPEGIRITLVSPGRHAPYSGMLPGFVAGHYDFQDCHIDLLRLCDFAKVKFQHTEAVGIDLAARRIDCREGGALEYDAVSIDIGSTSGARSVPGALDSVTRVKPVAEFVKTWNFIRATPRLGGRMLRLAVVGGGAGGVELALAMHHRLQADHAARTVELHLLTDTATILPEHAPTVRCIFERILADRGIVVHGSSKIVKVEPGILYRETGNSFHADHIIWATAAAAPCWIAASGIRTNARGFIEVDDTLRSVSHRDVFASGDIATMVNHKRPKSGVYAVRQGPPLAENLRRVFTGTPLVAYTPQKIALALISSGGRYAVASYGGVAFKGKWVWRWKDYLDRKFVARYNCLP